MNTVRIWFSKKGEASYISLLDLQRVMGRAIKRSGVPAWYTQGFNPHIYMTFACPLPLGQESLVESVDFKTEEEHPDFEAWAQALRGVMPTGIEVNRLCLATRKAEEIAWSRYTITYPAKTAGDAAQRYNALPQALAEKKSKRGVKTLDLKEYIPHIEVREEAEGDCFELLLPAGVSFTVNPALLTGFLEKEYGLEPWNTRILRTELLTGKMEKFE